VLDQTRSRRRIVDAADQPDDRLDLGRVQARHHLVEEEQRGSVASARASSSRLALGDRQGGRRDAGSGAEPHALHDLPRPAERLGRLRMAARAPTRTFSSTVMRANGRVIWNVPGEPEAADGVGREAHDRAAVEADIAAVRGPGTRRAG
jgi:hypothetical protein